MNRQDQIQNNVEQAMVSLDNIQRATANPFLYTRIQAALQKEEIGFWGSVTGFITKPAVAFATLLLVLGMNSLVFFNAAENNTASGSDEEQLFAREYSLATTTDESIFVSNEEQP